MTPRTQLSIFLQTLVVTLSPFDSRLLFHISLRLLCCYKKQGIFFGRCPEHGRLNDGSRTWEKVFLNQGSFHNHRWYDLNSRKCRTRKLRLSTATNRSVKLLSNVCQNRPLDVRITKSHSQAFCAFRHILSHHLPEKRRCWLQALRFWLVAFCDGSGSPGGGTLGVLQPSANMWRCTKCFTQVKSSLPSPNTPPMDGHFLTWTSHPLKVLLSLIWHLLCVWPLKNSQWMFRRGQLTRLEWLWNERRSVASSFISPTQVSFSNILTSSSTCKQSRQTEQEARKWMERKTNCVGASLQHDVTNGLCSHLLFFAHAKNKEMKQFISAPRYFYYIYSLPDIQITYPICIWIMLSIKLPV